MPRLVRIGPCFALALLAACGGSTPEDEPAEGAYSEVASRIINGDLDTTHQAVVATFGNYSGCTGTIIHKDGGNLYVLTAAHCFSQDPQRFVVQGDNYEYPSAVYNVADWQQHPSYSGEMWDFAMIRATGASASTPVIPAMSPLDDDLGTGTVITHVGYGIISWPNGGTSLRHYTTNVIDQFYNQGNEFLYNQPTSGPCSGDSGGPGLSQGVELVAGVVSRGDEGCNTMGVSGRVSRVYDDFIVPFIGVDPTETCGTCAQRSTMPQGACEDAYNWCIGDAYCRALNTCIGACLDAACVQSCRDNHPNGVALYDPVVSCICDTACVDLCATDPLCSGGTGGTGTGGTGGTGLGGGEPTGDQWVAGDQENLKYSGEKLGSCTLGSRSGPGPLAWLLLGLASGAVALGRRRRHAR